MIPIVQRQSFSHKFFKMLAINLKLKIYVSAYQAHENFTIHFNPKLSQKHKSNLKDDHFMDQSVYF